MIDPSTLPVLPKAAVANMHPSHIRDVDGKAGTDIASSNPCASCGAKPGSQRGSMPCTFMMAVDEQLVSPNENRRAMPPIEDLNRLGVQPSEPWPRGGQPPQPRVLTDEDIIKAATDAGLGDKELKMLTTTKVVVVPTPALRKMIETLLKR